jgi:hypothetical protein
LDKEISRFKREEKGIMTSEVLRPGRKTIRGDEEGFFELAV